MKENKSPRNKHKLSKFLLILALVFLLGVLFAWSDLVVPNKLSVIFFDVGQGDASLLKLPGKQTVLIDGGPDNSVLRGLGKHIPFYQRRLDLIIVSHYHDDHVTGLIEVLNRYMVKKIIFLANSPTSKISEIFLLAAEQKRIPIIFLTSSARINFSNDCSLFLLNPLVFAIPADDNNSLITKLDCHQTKYLFSGDSNSKVEKALIASKQDWRADVLKASHHGSITANSETFLQTVAPNFLIIPVGINNRFNHPSLIILERAARLGITIKRTDLDGEIEFIN